MGELIGCLIFGWLVVMGDKAVKRFRRYLTERRAR